MRKYFQLFMLIFITFLLVTGCNSLKNRQISIEFKSDEEQKEMIETFTYDDYKKAFDEVVAEARKIGEKDEQLNKWIIRRLAEEKLYYKTELTEEQVVQLAQEKMMSGCLDISRKRDIWYSVE